MACKSIFLNTEFPVASSTPIVAANTIMARRPLRISKSWLFLVLSIYSYKFSKNGDNSRSSAAAPPSMPPSTFGDDLGAVLMTPPRSGAYDRRVHRRGCRTTFT
uniref:Uncharacterized protein n=1 Tax=Opuntia streptacantha TaxID=393608 RepID=A0A7C8ZU16_OPUST